MVKNLLQDILTKEMLEYEYKNLGSMQKIANKFNVSIDSITKYMKLHGINYSSHYKGIYSCNDKFFSEDTEESFYWAGFIAADGNLKIRRNATKIIKICLALKDKDHLDKFKLSIKSNHPLKEYKVKPSKLSQKIRHSVQISIVSKDMFDDLNRFNIIPNKTKIYDMPTWMLNHPLSHHYLRGYFDGDGSISTCGLGKGRIVLQGSFSLLGNKEFINKYIEMLVKNAKVNYAKNCLKTPNSKHKVYSLSYSGNNNIKKIYYYLYKDATIWLDRKKEKLENFILK